MKCSRFTKLAIATAVSVMAAGTANALVVSEGVIYDAVWSNFVDGNATVDTATLTITINAAANTFSAESLHALSFYASSGSNETSSMTATSEGSLSDWGSATSGGLPDGSNGGCSSNGSGSCWDTANTGLATTNGGVMSFTFLVTAAEDTFLLGIGPHLKVSWYDNGQILSGHHLSTNLTPPIPEPSTYALMLAGLGAIGFIARRRRQA